MGRKAEWRTQEQRGRDDGQEKGSVRGQDDGAWKTLTGPWIPGAKTPWEIHFFYKHFTTSISQLYEGNFVSYLILDFLSRYKTGTIFCPHLQPCVSTLSRAPSRHIYSLLDGSQMAPQNRQPQALLSLTKVRRAPPGLALPNASGDTEKEGTHTAFTRRMSFTKSTSWGRGPRKPSPI